MDRLARAKDNMENPIDPDLIRVHETLIQAVCPEDVFGLLDGLPAAEKEDAVDRAFRQMARACHPDRFSGGDEEKELAHEVFQRLNEMRERAATKLGRGTYGERDASSDAEAGTTEIQTPKHIYHVSRTPLAQGDLAFVYRGTVAGGDGDAAKVVVKVARDPEDNDLVRNEIRVLTRLALEPGGGTKHLPVLLDQFKTEGKQALVLREIDAIDLPALREKLPAGVPHEHVAWILQRLLSALGYVHSKGIVHCNIEPAHIMVRPRDHNVFLIDWSYAAVQPAKTGEGFRTLNDGYSAPEVAERKPPTPASDLYSAGRCMVELLGGKVETNEFPPGVPDRLKRYLQFLLLPNPRMRAQDAWEMYQELSNLRQEVYGPKRFVELRV